MKDEILNILRMQQAGKLTQDQAAELLAVLADQARDKDDASAQHAPQGEAPGPQNPWEAAETKTAGRGSRFNAASASAVFHGIVDTAMGVGATVSRAATVWGTEFLHMVHRDEGGNSVTLSKVDSPNGDGFSFRDNTINVSSVGDLNFSQAQVSGNTINASKIAHLGITRGRIVQCTVTGSSLSHLTIEGPAEAIVQEGAAQPITPAGIRAATFNASKFSRVRILGASTLETCVIQATAAKDWLLAENSSLKDSRINDSHVAGLHLERSAVAGLSIEMSNVQSLLCRDATIESLTLSGIRGSDITVAGGKWNNVKFSREPGGIGGREASLQEITFENCTLSDCQFIGCTFRRTTLRNLTLAGITVRNVDFTGMKLESAEEFRRAAGL